MQSKPAPAACEPARQRLCLLRIRQKPAGISDQPIAQGQSIQIAIVVTQLDADMFVPRQMTQQLQPDIVEIVVKTTSDQQNPAKFTHPQPSRR